MLRSIFTADIVFAGAFASYSFRTIPGMSSSPAGLEAIPEPQRYQRSIELGDMSEQSGCEVREELRSGCQGPGCAAIHLLASRVALLLLV